MTQQSVSLPEDFIPARESQWFIRLFRWYVRWLFHRRFDTVYLQQNYRPSADRSTIYYLNHTSWWDGLIPFLLNEFRFHQGARAVMEDHQMRDYPFFSKIGAFSIDRSNPRSALKSLHYGLDFLAGSGRSLFIYPEGQIYPPEASPAHFERGLAWMADKIVTGNLNVDLVPIGIYMHTMASDRPQLLLNVGDALNLSKSDDLQTFSTEMRTQLAELVVEARESARDPEPKFEVYP
jgi:1-acyl-sn-glycerol-3-phosphate acyltransferase